MTLERYRDIVPDWDDFRKAVVRTEPVAFRAREGRVATDRLLHRLRESGFRIESVDGVAGFFRVLDGPRSVAQTLEHWLGLLHVQQAVMGLPSLALAPEPGERVLDLCAAPGGKTAHLAELMCEEGPLVAVDPKDKRIRGLLGNLYRLGLTNVVVVAADGRRLPGGALFDRVLVDAPCSGEGNCRRQGGRPTPRSPRFTRYVTALQEALLRRAIELVRPGGVVVYSTCTFAPEENEAVLDRVLRNAPVSVETIPLEAPHAPGLVHWSGHRFADELAAAWRVYPHHLDSGGLFMARLRRHGGPPTDSEAAASELAANSAGGAGCSPDGTRGGWSPVPPAFPGEDQDAAVDRIHRAKIELEHRFDIRADVLEEVGWMVRGDHVWLQSARHWPVETWATPSNGGWRVVSAGLRALRRGPHGRETPTSHLLTRWGREVGPERRVALDAVQLQSLLEGETLPPDDLPTGPVALAWRGTILGRGMVGKSGLAQEFGRARAARLLEILRKAV